MGSNWIHLTDYDTGGPISIRAGAIQGVWQLPESENYERRCRIDGANGETWLVNESHEAVMLQLGCVLEKAVPA